MKIRGQYVYSPQERIMRWCSIDEATGCWLWTGSTWRGYGRLTVGTRPVRKTIAAHRYSYAAFVGPIPAGMEVCHKCDVRPCVNPAHLFVGTKQDNIDDRERKGRNNHVVGERIGSAKLNSSQVQEMRLARLTGESFQKIANRFGVDKQTAYSAILGRTWGHVPAPPEVEEK